MSFLSYRWNSALLFMGILSLLCPSGAKPQDATISEKTQVFRTYPFGDPDPVARMGNIYPYFRFQGYSISAVDRPWRIVTLENRLIRVLVAPEVGGKVLGAFEKSTGRAFIYYNRVMKFREIAMRGPWTSGGIEFNFGDIGHAPTTSSPVDYALRKNPDGSVSCIVGALDLPSRTEWRVEIRLPRDRAMFETRSFWFNPTDLSTSLYHWTNAAVDADSTLQVLYPGSHYIGHGGEASAWPVDGQGRDLSYYRNNAFGSYKSYHVLGTYTDFFGARWRDFGVLHWSPYTEKPGKKLWIWGLSREGEIWVDLLADPPNTQYVEIQSGLHFNQAVTQSSRTPFKHMPFLPHSSESFCEFWFPFKGLTGVTRATPDGALSVQKAPGKVLVKFCPTGQFRDRISVTVGGAELYSRKVSLRPLEVFADSVSLEGAGPGAEAGPLSPGGPNIDIRIGSALRYRSSDETQRSLQRPIREQQPMDWSSAHGREVEARELARQRDYEGALNAYRSSLVIEPTYLPSLTGAAELLYRRMEHDSALALTLRALAIDTYDPQANYLHGLIQRSRGRTFDAREAFGIAARSRTFRPAALVQLAELALADGDRAGAEVFARRALENDAANMAALRTLAVLFRTGGHSTKAAAIRRTILAADPLSHFVRAEVYLSDRTNVARRAFTGGIRSELPQETFLELAAYYGRLGLWHDLQGILSVAPQRPMVDLWNAWAAMKSDDLAQSARLLDRALASSPAFVFPHRQEDATVLRWALEQKEHWKTRYFLGLLLWHYGRTREAGDQFDACAGRPDFAPFYLSRAAYRKRSTGPALADYRRARELAPDEWRTSALLASALNEQGEHRDALRICSAATERFPESYVLKFLLARTHVLAGDHAAARVILDTLVILPFEGSRIGRDIHRQAYALEAAAKLHAGDFAAARTLLHGARQWPERLGAGRPYEPDNRLEDYLEGLILRAQGDSTHAAENFRAVADYTLTRRKTLSTHHLFGALALRELGRNAEGDDLLREWLRDEAGNEEARWSLRIYRKEPVRDLETRLRTSVLNPSSGDQDFLLLTGIIKTLDR